MLLHLNYTEHQIKCSTFISLRKANENNIFFFFKANYFLQFFEGLNILRIRVYNGRVQYYFMFSVRWYAGLWTTMLYIHLPFVIAKAPLWKDPVYLSNVWSQAFHLSDVTLSWECFPYLLGTALTTMVYTYLKYTFL